MNSTQEFLFPEQVDYQMESLNKVEKKCLLCDKNIHAGCHAHKNPNCPYHCSYELPVGDRLLFLIVLSFVYASVKWLNFNN